MTFFYYNYLSDYNVGYRENCMDVIVKERQEHPATFSGKYLFGRRFEIYNFRNICCKISCLPASPRIFEELKNGITVHF